MFAATGREPFVAGLGLETAGVAVDHFNAVKVDGHSRTTADSVYAIGDITNRMNLTPVAIAEGHHLADSLFGPGPARTWSLANVATAIFSTPPCATVGLTEAQAALAGPADIYVSRFTPMRHTLGTRDPNAGRRTMMKLVVDQASQRVVGAHMIGDDAAEMMQGLSLAINCGCTKQDFDRTVGIHPTSAEEWVTMRTRTRVAEGPSLPIERPRTRPPRRWVSPRWALRIERSIKRNRNPRRRRCGEHNALIVIARSACDEATQGHTVICCAWVASSPSGSSR